LSLASSSDRLGSYSRASVPRTHATRGTWDLLLICLAVYLATAVGRVHQLFPILASFKLALVAGILSIGLYLACARGIRGIATLWSPTTKHLLLLLLWVALSIPGALVQGESFRLLTGDFIKTVIMYLVIVGAVRGPRDVERLVCVYFASAVVYAAVALSRFDIGDSYRWGALYFYDANDLATFIVTAFPLGLYFLLAPRRLAYRALGGVGLVVLAAAFLRTGSRGGFLALLGVAVFFLVGYSGLRVGWRILSTAVLVALFTLSASDSYWTRMQTILHPSEDYNYSSYAGRWQIWRRGVGYMLQRPLFGVGAGNFSTAEGTLSPEVAQLQERGVGVPWKAAHNSLVQIGAELGVPGLLFFLGMIVTTFGALRAVRRAERSYPPVGRGPPRLALPLTASFVGLVVGACFLSLAYQAMPYMLAAFAVALRKVTGTSAVARPRPALWRWRRETPQTI